MTTEINQNSIAITPDDKASINELFEKLSDAWACGDGEAYTSLFFEDTRFTGVVGFRLVGKKMVQERHQEMFDGMFKFSRLEGMPNKIIQPLTTDVVLVHSDGDVYFPGESSKQLKPTGLRTLSVVKRDGVWKVASFQNTPTGSFRHLKFIKRFLTSRIYLLSSKWKKDYKKILEEKQKNINKWKNQN